jgi:YVTN family beta-propeller protein
LKISSFAVRPTRQAQLARAAAVLVFLLVAAQSAGASAADHSAVAWRAASAEGQVSIDVGSNPDGIAVDAVTHMVYVANKGGDSVSVINGATNTVSSTVPVGTAPRGIAVDDTTDTIYVANSGDQTVSVISGTTGKVTATLTVGPGPDAVAVDDATDTIYVTWHEGIASIDGATNVVTPLAIDMPPVMGTGINDSLAADPSGNDLYLVNWLLSFVSVIDAATDQPVDHFDAGSAPDAVAVDPVHHLLYAGSCESGFFSGVWVISLASGDTLAQISDGCPTAVAADTATGTGVSIDQAAGKLSFIAGSPRRVTGSISVGLEPSAVAVDPASGAIYVADQTLGGTVTAVMPAAPKLTSPAAATFRTGTRGSFPVTATGYPAVTVKESGRLPRGITMSATGVLKGTPAAGSGGIYRVVVTASNAILPAATQRLTITVDQAPAITSPGRASFTAGHAHTAKITATGFPAPRITEKGTLPKGVKFTAGKNGTASISGTPAKSDRRGTYKLTLTAANGISKPATQAFKLVVR